MRTPTVSSCTDPGPWRYNDRWPWIHLGIAVVAGLGLFWNRGAVSDPRELLFLWLAPMALLLHQFEEHGVPGGFRPWFNSFAYRSQNSAFPLTKKLARQVNTGALLLGLAAGIAAQAEIWIGLAFLYACGANALFHITSSQLSRRYSPGTATGGLLLLPLACYATWRFVSTSEAQPWDLALAGLTALVLQGVTFFALHRRALRYPELLRIEWRTAARRSLPRKTPTDSPNSA